MTFRHGLVIGKFYPPHRGHQHLIETAARSCTSVTVVVLGARAESIPAATRVTWLRELLSGHPNVDILAAHDDAPSDFGSQVVWRAHVAVIAAAVARGRFRVPVDAVFSGEHYLPELARQLSATPVLVDPDRHTFPFSSSMFRADPVGKWFDLPAPVRRGLAVRIVVVGAESSGTSTLARDLADTYQARGGTWGATQLVPEYGRDYTELKFRELASTRAELALPDPAPSEIVWNSTDFANVAAEQTRLEEAAAAQGSPVLICDTDAFATSIWERRYVGAESHAALPWATHLLPQRSLYLLTDVNGVEFEDDGWRDGEHLRLHMHRWFIEALSAAGHSWFLVSGSAPDRLSTAIKAVDEQLRQRFTFELAYPD